MVDPDSTELWICLNKHKERTPVGNENSFALSVSIDESDDPHNCHFAYCDSAAGSS